MRPVTSQSLYHCAPRHVKAVLGVLLSRPALRDSAADHRTNERCPYVGSPVHVGKRDDRAESGTGSAARKFSEFLHGVYYITTHNRAAPRVRGRFRFGDALKLKYAIWLICLLLFVAAVDTIPDPPAINPPTSHSCRISARHGRGPFTLLEKEWLVASGSIRRDPLNWLSIRFALENGPVGVCTLPLFHHAADSSPPAIS
jgi:hypothetical protein